MVILISSYVLWIHAEIFTDEKVCVILAVYLKMDK